MAIGRISGPLLKSNLIRDGVDLAFETDLLYLDVNNARIGINSASPQYALDVVGTAKSTDLEVTNNLTIGNFNITGNTITSTAPIINFEASGGEATIYHTRVIINDIEIDGNTISTNISNSNLELRPNGTGIVDIQSPTSIVGDLNVTGNITATGDITIGGNLIIGDAITDEIIINASIKSDLIPETNNLYDLGSPTNKWRNIYAVNLTASNFFLDSFQVGNILLTDNSISTVTGNLILDASGTGAVRIGNFEIKDNTITNVVSGSVSEISQSGTGYFKISGTNGFVPPAGTTAERPTAYAVAGMTRYNTDTRALEVWDAVVSNWVSPAGTIGAVSESTALQIAAEMALTLG
jgi:hypothetical protein